MWMLVFLGGIAGFLVAWKLRGWWDEPPVPAWQPPIAAWGRLRGHEDTLLQRGVIDLDQLL